MNIDDSTCVEIRALLKNSEDRGGARTATHLVDKIRQFRVSRVNAEITKEASQLCPGQQPIAVLFSKTFCGNTAEMSANACFSIRLR